MSHTWSDQQLAIFAHFATSPDNLVAEALAGTGKSTTLLEAINHAPEQHILLVAFSRKDADELKLRLANPRATSSTFHALGFACVRLFWERVGVNKPSGRVPSRAQSLTERVCGATAPDAIKKLVTILHSKGREITPHAKDPSVWDSGRMVERGVLYDVAYEFECVPDAEWVAAGFDLAYVESRALAAMDLAATQKPSDGIDFADMIYLPIRNGWLRPVYDLVVVDETQDMNAAQLEMARKVCSGRMAFFGDSRQSVYRFRGADSDGMDRMKREMNATALPLTITYRCSRRVVAEAQRLVPEYQAHASNSEGEILAVPYAKLVDTVEVGDFVLSRKNAPLAAVAMAMIRAQKRVKVAGKDIGAGLKSILGKLTKAKRINSVPAFLEKLATWEERECERAERGKMDSAVERVHDQADTLRTLSDGAPGLQDIEARIDALFTDDGLGDAGYVICSSVHKAKGREANRVFVLRDTLYPKRKKTTPAQEREERNIEYVSITRARNTLVWVDGLPGSSSIRSAATEASHV